MDRFREGDRRMHQLRTACRACGSYDMFEVFDLGDMCINGFPAPGEPDSPKVPLRLCLCPQCSLVQLRHTVDADSLFRKFHYRSSVTKTMQQALVSVVSGAMKHVQVNVGDVVVDIGANDGLGLRCWPEQLKLERIGFEPALN